MTGSLLQREHLLLHGEGLDTLAQIFVNGVEVGQAENMFRTWEFDVKKLLQPGTNSIEVRFAPVLPMLRAKETVRPLPTWQYTGAAYVRKMPCNFGWDWGPTLVTCGIWQNIALVGFDTARLDDVQILQDHLQNGKVKLTVRVSAGTDINSTLSARLTVTSPDGKILKPFNLSLTNGVCAAEFLLDHPKLWWPAGMGAQPLYTIQTELFDSQRKLLDGSEKRIGLRTMQVLEPTKSSPMQFVVNGVPCAKCALAFVSHASRYSATVFFRSAVLPVMAATKSAVTAFAACACSIKPSRASSVSASAFLVVFNEF